MDQRLNDLSEWLSALPDVEVLAIAPASVDASFRRYFRVQCAQGSYIAMDAPPERESCDAYIAIAGAMKDIGLNVPRILHHDLAQGFLLLTDLGDSQYLTVIDEDNADPLYRDAMMSLLKLQRAEAPEGRLPAYSRKLLLDEMALFTEWFIERHLSLSISIDEQAMLARVSEWLADNALAQPAVWVHRDYHSRNLMRVENDNPGILDFQDAVIGPVTYDLVSLLRDCYVAWPHDRVRHWARDYFQLLSAEKICLDDWQTFLRWFDLMGIQRHMKAVGIFARLNRRDSKPGYLKDIPRTMSYILTVANSYPELEPYHAWLKNAVLPAMEKTGLNMPGPVS